MKRIAALLFSLFLFTLIGESNAYSQEGRPLSPPGGPGAAKFEQFKKMRIIETLHLDDETAIRFVTK